jgi:hypothetical protein
MIAVPAMPFDLHKIEAQLSLSEILPEKLPDVACDALEAGYDGPAIRRMASFIAPTGWETDPILPAFRAELGMQVLSRLDATLRIAYDLAIQIIESRSDGLDELPRFARLCSQIDYPRELTGLYSLDDEYYRGESIFGRSVKEVAADTHDALIELIRDFEAAHSIP